MLRDLKIKPGYETPVSNIAREFYDPALSEAISYDRISGYFSSKSLAFFSKGIESLIRNNGHYRLIISSDISPEDYDAIVSGYERRDILKQLSDKIEENMPNLDDNKNMANLAYLISIGLVDIKIGFKIDGIFHAKYGIITDANGDSVYFSGSFNETANAFAHNYENIDTKKSWSDTETEEYINNHRDSFNKLWNGTNTDGMIFVKEINEVVKKKIAKYSKGKLIMEDELLSPESLILYMSDKQLYIQDNLGRKLQRSRKIRRIKEDFLVDGVTWNFKPNLGYKVIQDNVIPDFEKLAQHDGFKFVVAKSVTKFINESKYEIDTFSLQGINIKNEDPMYQDYIKKFKQIVDKEITRELRPIQLWVSFYMVMMQRVGNFSVPGAGKTAMVYGSYAYLSAPEINKVDKLVVIGPKSSFLAWKTEFKAVFGDKRKLSFLDVQDSDFKEEQLYKNVNQYNLILVNYESLPKYERALEGIINAKTLLVFDEVHKLKGIKSERPKYAQPLSELALYKFALTGTPIPNGYIDIYNMLHFLYKDEYRDYFGFSKSELLNADEMEGEIINKKLNPFFWRVTKKDLGVPAPEPDHMVPSDATDDEQQVIDILWRKYSKQPFKLYIRLIQMASNPGLLEKSINKSLFIDDGGDQDDNGTAIDFEYNDSMQDEPDYSADELQVIHKLKSSSKFEKAINKATEIIEANKNKSNDDPTKSNPIVWAIFVDTIDKFTERMEKKGYKVAKIYGSVAPSEREEIIKKFQNHEYDMLISNPHTLAESVSLHRVSHDALYLEYSFNLTHMLQSRDRIHRLGLESFIKTNYYYFELFGKIGERQPIDDLIYNRLDDKRKLMINSIEGHSIKPEFTTDETEEVKNLMKELMKEN